MPDTGFQMPELYIWRLESGIWYPLKGYNIF